MSVDGNDRRQAVIDAASRCFEQYGIAKTSMQDVARAAGLSRQALYRSFPSRQKLVELVLRRRLSELVEAVLPRALALGTFPEAFIEAAMAAVDYVRSTPDLRRLLRETSIDEACRTMLVPEAELMKVTVSLWQPILAWGRSRGEIRTDLIDEDFIEWTATIVLIYSARHDISHEQLRSLLHRHLLPVVVSTRP
jgi:AcrR family transcriptional regulator